MRNVARPSSQPLGSRMLLPVVILVFTILLGVSFVFENAFATVLSSPLSQFNITPATLRLNWTNNYYTNITVSANNTLSSSINITILNSTSGVSGNYSQGNTQDYCLPSYYHLFVNDSEGRYNNSIDSLAVGGNANYTIIDTNLIYNHLSCKPGRYWIEKFNIINANRANESANITVFIDIPISDTNNVNLLNLGMGYFNGKMPINATTYHSYYFNTSIFPNATGVLINLTGWSSGQDADLFLLDASGNLKAKSVNSTSISNESLLYNYLPKNEWWEIRVFGNSTSLLSYSGMLAFSTLNATNSSDSNEQVTSIGFGIMNTSETKDKYITLENEGTRPFSLRETKELYYVKKFAGSASANFTFFVPGSSVTKIKTVLNWTGGANYSFDVYNGAEAVVGKSAGRYEYANTSGVTQEVNNETTAVSVGMWRVQVTNNTNIADEYNATVYLYVDSPTWIKTNYSSEVVNSTENPNSTRDIKINITIQNNTMDGLFEGYIAYLDGNNTGIKLPLSFNVTTPMLIVNNTLNSATFTTHENYNTTLTRYMYINVSNPGAYNLTVSITGKENLTCSSGSSCSGYNGSLVFNTTNTIPANNFVIIEANLSFNHSMPKGVYKGYIYINGTNDNDFNLSARPSNTFNATLQLNLTDDLDVRVLQIITAYGGTQTHSTSAENVMAKTRIYYINGTTEIDAGTALNTSNFFLYLTETNVSFRIPATSYLDIYNGTTPIFIPPYYSVNFTVPANRPGGIYNVHVIANYTDSSRGFSYSGEGTNSSLIINNTGLYMRAHNDTSFTITNGSTKIVYVNVSNYGPKASTSAAYIQFQESCDGFSIAATSSSCPAATVTKSGARFTLNTFRSFNTSCLLWWTITAGNSAASACNATAYTDSANTWFDSHAINVTVTVTVSADGVTPPSGGVTPGLPTYVANLEFTKAESIVGVKQNETNTTTVIVKNTGNKTQTITFTITNISSSLWSVNASTATLARGDSVGFLVTFTPSNTGVGDYKGYYKAYSSDKTIESSLTLRVRPSTKGEVDINVSLVEYRAEMLELQAEINQSKARGINVTATEAKFAELKSKIEQAEAYIAAGDYFQAHQLLDEIENLFTETRAELESAKAIKLRPDWLFWAIIISGIVGGGFLIYLFWPTKAGYRPETGEYTYKPKKKKIIPSVKTVKIVGAAPVKVVGRVKEKLKERKRKKEAEYERVGFKEE